MKYEPRLVSSGVQLFGKGKECNKMGTKGTTMEFFYLKQPHGANKYLSIRPYTLSIRPYSTEYTAVY